MSLFDRLVYDFCIFYHRRHKHPFRCSVPSVIISCISLSCFAMPISDPSSATSSTAQAIAGLLLQALAEGSASSTLISTIGVEKMRAHLEACMPYEIERPFKRYLVIKDTETNQIISYVTWALPHSAAELNSEAKEFQEKISKLREEGKLPQRPEGMNTELGKVFGEKVGAMRDRVLGQESRPHYCTTLQILQGCCGD
jgi:hypothetical protein